MGKNDNSSTMTSASATKLSWEEREAKREEREREREEQARFDREEFYRRAKIQDEQSESSVLRDIERLSIYRSDVLDMRAYREFTRKELQQQTLQLQRIADAVEACAEALGVRFK